MQKDPEVEKFLKGYEHPMKAEIQVLRQLIHDSSLDIREGVKWNSLSFQTSDWFATLNKRETSRIEIVLHFGAKKKDGADVDNVDDPAGLLKKLAKDRCLLAIDGGEDLRAKQSAIKALVRDWIRYV